MPTANIERYVAVLLGDGTVVDGSNPFPTSATVVGGGSAVSVVDASGWTAGTTLVNPIGAVFNDAAAALTTGQEGTLRATPNRGLHANLRDNSGVETGTAGNPLHVTVIGGGSATSAADEAAWTAGTSLFNPAGGVFNDTATALTAGQQGTFRVTPNRAQHANLRDNSGNEIGISGRPVRVDPTGTTTQPVSGTVSSNQGTPNAVGNAWPVEVTDGTNVLGVALHPLRTDPTGTTTQPISAASLPLPTGAATDATLAGIKTGTDKIFNVADAAAWTAGTSLFNPAGGVFNDAAAPLTAGQEGTLALTAHRAQQVNLRDSSGNELTPVTISTANSSTTPLAANGVFTGLGEDVSRYGSVQVSVLADQAAAANGLSLQWSSDNSHWDLTEVFAVVANQAMSVRASVKGRFFRLVYTNGTTLQTAFRLQTFYQTASAPGTSTSTLGAFMGPTPGAQFSISMPYTFDSSTSTWGPVSGAKNLVAGILGGALPASQVMVYNTGDSKFYPVLTTTAGSGTTGIGLLGTGPLSLAVAHGANPTAVTAGQYAPRLANRAGLPFMMGGHPNVQTVRANYTTAQANTVLVANSAGTKIVVTGFMVTVDNATTVNVQARLGLAASTTPTTTQVFGSHPGIAPGSGFGRGSGAGMLAVGADGDQILITSGVPTSGSVDVVVEYYTVAS